MPVAHQMAPETFGEASSRDGSFFPFPLISYLFYIVLVAFLPGPSKDWIFVVLPGLISAAFYYSRVNFFWSAVIYLELMLFSSVSFG